MKKKLPANLIKFRIHSPNYEIVPDDDIQGIFLIPYMDYELKVMCGVGDGWDHVSVSLNNREPYWPEMEFIRRLFFENGETVLQIHPPIAQHINLHPYVLHLWRAWHVEYTLPPRYMLVPGEEGTT